MKKIKVNFWHIFIYNSFPIFMIPKTFKYSVIMIQNKKYIYAKEIQNNSKNLFKIVLKFFSKISAGERSLKIHTVCSVIMIQKTCTTWFTYSDYILLWPWEILFYLYLNYLISVKSPSCLLQILKPIMVSELQNQQ